MEIINQKYKSLSKLKNDFFNARPFPHIILDDFLDGNFFKLLTEILQQHNEILMGKNFSSDVESNKSITTNSQLPVLVSKIVDELNTQNWVDNFKKLTGIETLVASKSKLANYHEMECGGILGPHVDHSSEPNLGLPHVLNIIIYISSDWEVDFGGSTIFFNPTGVEAKSKVEYIPNRAVIFLHTPYSFHGVDRLKDNGDIKRKTLYIDYYSESITPFKHMELPFKNHWFKHGTTFILPKLSDYLKSQNRNYAKTYIKYLFGKAVS
jgi:hypothetical protein